MSDHKRRPQPSSSGHAPSSLSVLGSTGKAWWLSDGSLFSTCKDLRGTLSKEGFPSLLGLGSDEDGVPPALHRCREGEEGMFCASGVAKVAVPLAYARDRLPCEG